MKRIAIFIVFLCIFIFLFSPNALADEQNSGLNMPDEYQDFIDSIPDSVIENLPDGFFSDNAESIKDGIYEMTSPKKLLSLIFNGIFVGLSDVLPTLAVCIGILILSSVIDHVNPTSQMCRSVCLISRLCIVGSVISLVFSSISVLGEYFTSLCNLGKAYIPLSAVLYAWGGNVSAAVLATSSFGICLSICQFIFTYTAIPVFVFCASLTVVLALDGTSIVSNIIGSVKKYYLMLLSIVMTTLGVCISSQTYIASKADSVSMRGAKLILGNIVPVTGGTLSSSLGAVATGVELIRSCVGIGGIIIVLVMLIPIISHLVLMRLFFFVLDAFSTSLGDAGRGISKIGELYSFLLGVACISCVVFILMFALLGFCASAVG